MHASNQNPIRRNAASCLATASFAMPTASSFVSVPFLAPRTVPYSVFRGPQLLKGIGKQGRREGASHRRVYRTAAFCQT